MVMAPFVDLTSNFIFYSSLEETIKISELKNYKELLEYIKLNIKSNYINNGEIIKLNTYIEPYKIEKPQKK